jgi:flagellar hook-basal body complex protein FliE
MTSVNNISTSSIFTAGIQKAAEGATTGTSFKDTLSALISQVNTQMQEADKMTNDFALGKSESLHEVMLATEKSSISLSFLLQVRGKLLDAYQEIMRMSF